MKDRSFKNKQVILIFCMSVLSVLILCTEFLMSRAVEATRIAAMDMSFPVSVKDFLAVHNFNYLSDDSTDTEALGYLPIAPSMRNFHLDSTAEGWSPTEILGYAKSDADLPSIIMEKPKINIISKNENEIEVYEVVWGTRKSLPYTSLKEKTYLLSDDVEIWLRIGTKSYFRMPTSDLDSYQKTVYGRSTKWAFALSDGMITSLVEYHP